MPAAFQQVQSRYEKNLEAELRQAKKRIAELEVRNAELDQKRHKVDKERKSYKRKYEELMPKDGSGTCTKVVPSLHSSSKSAFEFIWNSQFEPKLPGIGVYQVKADATNHNGSNVNMNLLREHPVGSLILRISNHHPQCIVYTVRALDEEEQHKLWEVLEVYARLNSNTPKFSSIYVVRNFNKINDVSTNPDDVVKSAVVDLRKTEN